MSAVEQEEYTYLTLPPAAQLRSCVGLVLAGMAMRANVGVGGLEEAVEVLESFHSAKESTRYRFSSGEESVVAEVEEAAGGGKRWRTVVELIS